MYCLGKCWKLWRKSVNAGTQQLPCGSTPPCMGVPGSSVTSSEAFSDTQNSVGSECPDHVYSLLFLIFISTYWRWYLHYSQAWRPELKFSDTMEGKIFAPKKREASQLFSIQTSRSVSISNWSLVKYFTCPETTTQQSPCLTYLETYLYSYLESIEGNVSSPKQKRKVIKKTFEQKLTGTSSALCWEQACFKQAYSDNHEYTPALPPLCSIQHQGKRTKLSFQ